MSQYDRLVAKAKRLEWQALVAKLEVAYYGASFYDMPSGKVARIVATDRLGYGYEGY